MLQGEASQLEDFGVGGGLVDKNNFLFVIIPLLSDAV
jgi:hypothetical protein